MEGDQLEDLLRPKFKYIVTVYKGNWSTEIDIEAENPVQAMEIVSLFLKNDESMMQVRQVE